jgi:replicative DNA helicase
VKSRVNGHRNGFKSNPLSCDALYSKDAEMAILSSILAHPECYWDVETQLEAHDFFVGGHKTIFQAVSDMMEAGVPVDVATLHQKLTDNGTAKEVGSPGILAELATGFSSPRNVMTYVKTVRGKALLRGIHASCVEGLEMVQGNDIDPSEVLDKVQQKISRIGMAVKTGQIAGTDEILDEFLAWIKEVEQSKEIVGIKTGFSSIDEHLIPLENGTVTTIAARPSIGKSAFAKNLLENWCMMEYGVGVFSLEMTKRQMMRRIFAYMAGINSRKFNQPLNAHDKPKFEDAERRIREWNFRIEDRSDLTIADIRRLGRQMVRMHGCKVIIIDYAQLIESANKKTDFREQEVAAISRGVKAMAKELEIPVILLAQLNRKGEDCEEPMLHMIRESGSIEQDSHNVLFLYPGSSSGDRLKKVKVKIAKQREGVRDKVIEMNYDAMVLRFSDIPEKKELV